MTELLEGIYAKLQEVNLKTYFNILPADIDTNAVYIVYEVSTTNSDNSLYQKNYANNLDITVKILGKDALELFQEGERVKGALLEISDIVFRSSIPVFADYDLGVNQYTLKFEAQTYGHVFKLLTYKELSRYTIQELKDGLTEEQISELQEHLPLSDYTIQQLKDGLSEGQINGLQLFKPLPDYTIQELQEGLTQDQINGLQYIPSSFEPETLAFQSRVIADGGKILDINKLDAFFKVNKYNGLYNSLQFAVSKQFGYKVDENNNIIKIYDASKNGNDLDISRGTVPEDIENDMFFLNNAHFKNESVVMDSIPESFATSISLLPEETATGATYKAVFSLSNNADGRIEHCYGGTNVAYIHRESLRLKYNENDLITLRGQTTNDVSKNRVYYKIDGINKKFIGVVNGTETTVRNDNRINPGTILNFTKIVLGGTSTEWVDGDADCHVGDTFFYNELLTTDELDQINGETPISEVLNFGFATDIHFSSKTPSGGRNYPDGLVKLQEAVGVWNTENVDFVLLNGDLIDHGGMTKATAINELGDLMENVISNITAPTYFSIGNHDIDVLTKSEFMSITQMNEKYYSFDLKGIHFIVLDTCYNSFSDSDDYSEGNYGWQTAYINPSQLTFVENDLDLTELPTVVMCHHRIDNEGDYGVKNAADIRTVLEASGKVIAVVQGHQHINAKTNINGIVYYEMMAATINPFPANAYSIIRIYDDNSIEVVGFGSQSNYI